MQLQTQIPISKVENQIDYQSKLLLLGSCFVENIGSKLGYYQFQSIQNPFGILFHPLAIEKLLFRLIEGRKFQKIDFAERDGIWYCFEFHSRLAAPSLEEALELANEAFAIALEQLKSATHIVVTFGTSWLYRHTETQEVVANCHKLPQQNFTKELLSVEEIGKSLEGIDQAIKEVNTKAKLLLTVSPIRHLKDGFVENQRSKAHLVIAVHQFLSMHGIHTYFPSYELMLDELRDYRFYAEDMLHPNELAIAYIWERFKAAWISSKAHTTMGKVEEVQKGLEHRPVNPNGKEHQQFMATLQKKIGYLQEEYPFMNFVE